MIYICLPVHNEQSTVGLLLWRIRKLLTEPPRDFQIIVVDDASTDRTLDVLEPYGRILPLTVLHNESRRGYAASLEQLLRTAVERSAYPKRDAALVLQADFSEAPEYIPDMLRRFDGGADLVSGRVTAYRLLPRAVRLARLGASVVARTLRTPEGVGDPLCGFRLYRLITLRRALDGLPAGSPLLRHHGWAANAELLTSVWPHVRQAECVDLSLDYSRHSRDTRLRPAAQLWAVLQAGRDRRLRSLRRTDGERAPTG